MFLQNPHDKPIRRHVKVIPPVLPVEGSLPPNLHPHERLLVVVRRFAGKRRTQPRFVAVAVLRGRVLDLHPPHRRSRRTFAACRSEGVVPGDCPSSVGRRRKCINYQPFGGPSRTGFYCAWASLRGLYRPICQRPAFRLLVEQIDGELSV